MKRKRVLMKALDLSKRAVIYGNLGKHKEAIDLCKEAIKIMPNYAEAYSNLYSAYGNRGDFESAIISCQKALEIDPALSSAHINLSVAYYYTKRYDLAIKHCDRAIKLGFEVYPKFLEALRPYRK